MHTKVQFPITLMLKLIVTNRPYSMTEQLGECTTTSNSVPGSPRIIRRKSSRQLKDKIMVHTKMVNTAIVFPLRQLSWTEATIALPQTTTTQYSPPFLFSFSNFAYTQTSVFYLFVSKHTITNKLITVAEPYLDTKLRKNFP